MTKIQYDFFFNNIVKKRAATQPYLNRATLNELK